MAITASLPGVEVTIDVDNQPLQEYIEIDLDEGPNTVTRYVEARTGQEFRVSCTATPELKFLGNCISFHVYVDGQSISHVRLEQKAVRRQPKTKHIRGLKPDHKTVKPFVFDSLELVCDARMVHGEASRTKNIGTIRVEAHHKVNSGIVSDRWSGQSRHEIGIVSEKALKGRAISHHTSYGPAVAAAPCVTFNSKYVNDTKMPAATFKFHYRSRESLVSSMIIPRTPSPPPIEEKEELTAEEIKELQRQYRALKENMSKVKRERAEENNTTSNKRRRTLPSSGDVLLTIDDSGISQALTTNLPPREQPQVINIDSD